MTIIIDEVTRQRVLTMPNTGDITYDLDINAGSAIAMETVPVIGPWEDFTGSNVEIDSKAFQTGAGTEDQFQGTDQGIEGERLGRLNIVGQPDSTTRRRLIKRYNANEGNEDQC